VVLKGKPGLFSFRHVNQPGPGVSVCANQQT
jgi:hypothetical protein